MSKIDYDIKAVPTYYKGRLYRSRLEARWAVFFDLMKWPFEYEPVDLGEWSPDFRLTIGHDDWLVEVKHPNLTSPEKIAIHQKMLRASNHSTYLLYLDEPFFEPTKYVWEDGYPINVLFPRLGDVPMLWGAYKKDDILYTEFIHSDLIRYDGRWLLLPTVSSPIEVSNQMTYPLLPLLNDCWIEAANQVQFLKPLTK